MSDWFTDAVKGAASWFGDNVLEPITHNKENWEYQKNLQEQIFNREDSAISRQAADLAANGMSKTLAAGSGGASAGAVVGAKRNSDLDSVVNALAASNQMAQIARTRADIKATKLKTEEEQWNFNIAKKLGLHTDLAGSPWAAVGNYLTNLISGNPSSSTEEKAQSLLGNIGSGAKDVGAVVASAGAAVADSVGKAASVKYGQDEKQTISDSLLDNVTLSMRYLGIDPTSYGSYEAYKKAYWSKLNGRGRVPARSYMSEEQWKKLKSYDSWLRNHGDSLRVQAKAKIKQNSIDLVKQIDTFRKKYVNTHFWDDSIHRSDTWTLHGGSGGKF